MHNALVTINFGDYLCANARASFQDAAKRWNAEYIEIGEQNGVPGIGPYEQKLALFSVCDADRVFCIDADATIRQDAPSPFDICPRTHLGAARNCQDSLFDRDSIRRVEGQDWAVVNARLGAALPFPQPYFNAGVLVLSRLPHAPVLERARALMSRFSRATAFFDQTYLNYAFAAPAPWLLLLSAPSRSHACGTNASARDSRLRVGMTSLLLRLNCANLRRPGGPTFPQW